ncbi:cobalt-zinc-cadmium resistance protein CzcA [Candidatus Kryptonium thompsonii]|uniref:Cobalt-zinc-cadmium resistance protein CzcA n=2 Tax=Candidatus Kryptonium thompsonii TaxID=1633631 RepID=A0A0P1P5B5_9BACT|nr:CusA/CzcA family heavy metal efflux RND transporter [Candidatus Kryptonium thompsoni]CUS78580.1 cobalt-zinc-cadmium resistance protein CzcA [Candidatus Kryptonium thompsoni]CUS78783.1 cobalt-zinc-cadmium resistance protein CzcA [Candidatus Kryptonium thompsoni]CUS79804.1 cobalt-zinc-cadmium resistance protein CzcA [Candidatus Kryptonium thompsoni]CUS80384.1 cobalt-zinc-cadmium resistance protein CzcA [Candidatus Kryptonium thompsoni]CUS85514.1 cobalt-zinc-cadmium resistance protein CzcA [Ca
MIERILRFSLKQKLLVLFGVILLIAGGIAALRVLPIDAVPDVTNIQVQIITSSPTLAPLEVERYITFPIEVAMSGLPGVEEIRSISKFGLSVVTVVFHDNVDIYFARQLVFERLQTAKENIPPEFGTPKLGPISTGLGEIYQYIVRPKDKSVKQDSTWLMETRTLQDWIVKRHLLTVPGVNEVNSWGGIEKQYQVLVDPQKLLSYNLTLRDVFNAIAENNANAGGAYIEHANEQYLIRGSGLVQNIEDIKNIIVKTNNNGTPIYVHNVADVKIDGAIRQGAVTMNDNGEVVAGIVMMLKGENSRVVVNRVKEKIEAIKRALPDTVTIEPFYDRTELVNKTIRTVTTNLIEGGILVILILILLLFNLRGGFIVASVIPLSMLFAVIMMVATGVSGNLMSLGAIDFGLIVDGAVVMVENAVRRLNEKRNELTTEETLLESALEVGRPIVFGVGIIIIVYLPIMTLTGMEGKMFRPMAYTVTYALIGALILSLTYVPAMNALIFRKGNVAEKESPIITFAKRIYVPLLRKILHKRVIVAGVAATLVVISLIIFPFLGSEFIPQLDEGSIAIQVLRLPSSSLTTAVNTSSLIEKEILKFPEVNYVVSKTGRAEIGTDPMGVEMSDILVMLKPEEEWKTGRTKEELVNAMSKELSKFPGMIFSFSQPIQLRVAELIAGVRSDIAIKIFGEDLDTLKEKAEEIAKVVSKIRGAADVKVEQVSGLPQLVIKPDRAKIARYGINVADVNQIIEIAIAGKSAGEVFEGEKRFDLVVRFKEDARNNIDAIKNILVPTPNGSNIPLSQIADVYIEEGPAQISREHGQRRIVVELNVRGRDIGSFVEEAEKIIYEKVKLPPGYYLEWGGTFEQLQRARERLAVVVPLSLFLIFLLLFISFGSIRNVLLVFTGIPFAIVGGIFSLLIRGMHFSISAGVGFIALFGVAVLNGIVMVSFINKLRQEGKPLEEAVIEGATIRLRPVLMTALVASLGFIPMAISTGAGAEVQRPLATVVIGGLITSTLLTLFVLPTLYMWFEKQKEEPEL